MSAKNYEALANLPENAGLTFGELYERSEDIPSNPSAGPTMGDVINARLGRRGVLGGMLATAAMSAAVQPGTTSAAAGAAKPRRTPPAPRIDTAARRAVYVSVMWAPWVRSPALP